MAGDAHRRRWRSIFVIGAFAYLSLMVGVVIGTLAAFISRWVPTALPPAATDSVTWLVLIALLLLITLWLGRWLLRRTLQSRSTLGLAGIPAILTLLALLSLWAWLAPGTDLTERNALGATPADTQDAVAKKSAPRALSSEAR